MSHGASIFSFPGQNPDSRRQGGRPALAPGPCAARAEDSLCGALRVPEAVRYEGHSELRRAVGANAAGLPHGHAPPRALVAAPGPEPPCVKSFHLTHVVREVTRLASHRTAGGGFPLKTAAAFEQAPEGTFFAFTEVKTITVKQLAQCPKLKKKEKEKKKRKGKNLMSTQEKKTSVLSLVSELGRAPQMEGRRNSHRGTVGPHRLPAGSCGTLSLSPPPPECGKACAEVASRSRGPC